MKKFFLFPFVLLISLLQAKAQNCAFFPFRAGTEIEQTSYNDKDKATGKTVTKIKNVRTEGSATIADVHVQSYDDKNKLLHEGDITFECSGGEIKMDMKSFMNPDQMDSWKDMQVKIEASKLSYPSPLTPGTTLPDGSMSVKVYPQGTEDMAIATVNINVVNRKVEANENVTCPAGNFSCAKLTSEVNTVTTTIGIPIKVNVKSVEWIAEGKWVVRSESYNLKNNKLMDYTVLSKITIP